MLSSIAEGSGGDMIRQMDYPRKHVSLVLGAAALAVGFFLYGQHVGVEKERQVLTASIINQVDGKPQTVDFSSFWKAWNLINEKFVPPVGTSTKPVTNQARVYGAIQGMVSSLGDPYTVFFPPVESEMFASDIKGNFEGVGMEFDITDGVLTVVAPLKGSPAEIAGLRTGDRIIRINDTSAQGISNDEAVKLIRGPKGTKVTFTVVRAGARNTLDITVVRDVINVPVIVTKDLGGGIFKIDLYSFTENSADLFRGALRQFVESGNDKLILDLRGNPGGYLDAAIDMASWFLPSGKAVVRESFGEGKDEMVYRSKGYNVFNENLKFVILVDGGSASASEILAGALSEHGKATLIGDTTFGKGSVQELVNVTNDTTLKVTIAHWLTPNGSFITGEGIAPFIKVKRTQADVDAGRDPQLDRAIQFLKTGK